MSAVPVFSWPSGSRGPMCGRPSSRRTSTSARGSPSLATDVTTWVQDVFGGFTYGVRDAVTKGILNPLESLLTESPWWLVVVVVVALAALLGGWRGAASGGGLPGTAGRDRRLARRHGHARVDPARHRRGGCRRHRSRRVDRTEPPGRQLAAAGARRGADDAAVRVPGAVPGVVRDQPVHRDRGGGGVRRTGDHQDRCRRHQSGAGGHGGGGELGRLEQLAGDQQGATARSRAGRSHWPSTRA